MCRHNIDRLQGILAVCLSINKIHAFLCKIKGEGNNHLVWGISEFFEISHFGQIDLQLIT